MIDLIGYMREKDRVAFACKVNKCCKKSEIDRSIIYVKIEKEADCVINLST